MKTALLAFVLATNLLITPVVLASASAPQLGDPILVVAQPWSNASRLVTDAGGQLLGPVQAPFASMSILSSEAYLETLYQNGVWLILNGKAIAAICGIEGVL